MDKRVFRFSFLAGIALFCSSCEYCNWGYWDAKAGKAKLDALRVGMTKQEVIDTVGEPLRDEIFNKPEVWYYYTDLKWSDGRISSDECTPLVFKNGRLAGWGNDYLKDKVKFVTADDGSDEPEEEGDKENVNLKATLLQAFEKKFEKKAAAKAEAKTSKEPDSTAKIIEEAEKLKPVNPDYADRKTDKIIKDAPVLVKDKKDIEDTRKTMKDEFDKTSTDKTAENIKKDLEKDYNQKMSDAPDSAKDKTEKEEEPTTVDEIIKAAEKKLAPKPVEPAPVPATDSKK